MPKANPSDTSPTDVMNTAVRILSRRSHSRKELKQKLTQRGFAGEAVEQTIRTCERYGYLNDEETSRIYFRELRARGYGPKRIRRDMKKKGLEGASVEKRIARYVEGDDEKTVARRVCEKKMRTFNRETDRRKRREKIYRFLYGRGFSAPVIFALLEEMENHPETE